jgi:crossover junction endodeoxyribonuclease RuvC
VREEGTSAHGLHAAREARAPVPIVLGIDPGTRVVGYGAIVVGAKGPRLFACGALRAERDDDVPARLAHLRTELDLLLAKVKPTVVVVEAAFAARNVQSALRIGEGRGVVLACAAATGARIVQYPPAVAKKALIGNGAADKSQVACMVTHLLGLAEAPKPLDATDALALALAFALRGDRIGASTARSARRAALPGVKR